MLRTCAVLLCCGLLATLAPIARAQPLDDAQKDIFRNALEIPVLDTAIHCNVTEGGFVVSCLKPREASEASINGIMAEMQGNASDAERYFLFSLIHPNGDEKKKAAIQAVTLLRQRLKLDPEDTDLLAMLGTVLYSVDEKNESETVLRDVARKSPNNWRGWAGLGRILKRKTYETLPCKKNWTNVELMDDESALFTRKPIVIEIEAATALALEASYCFDKAVAAAPSESRTYIDRAEHRGRWLLMKRRLDLIQDKKPDFATVEEATFAPACVADVERAAELRPLDCRAILTRAFFTLLSTLAERNKNVHKSDEIIENWNKRIRREFERAEAGLVALTREPDRRTATEAAECLGILCAMYTQFLPAPKEYQMIRWFRTAIDSNLASDAAWDSVIRNSLESSNDAEAISLCEKRLRQKDSARFHYWLAMIHFRKNRLTEAEAQFRAGLKSDADDIHCHAGLADVFAKRGTPEMLQQALAELEQVRKLLEKKPSVALQRYCDITQGITFALQGNRQEACKLLRSVAERTENEGLKLAIAILDPPSLPSIDPSSVTSSSGLEGLPPPPSEK